MPTSIVLALAPSPDGSLACLSTRDGQHPPVRRLHDQLREHGEVVVVTWTRSEQQVRAVLPPGADVVAVDRLAALLRWLASGPEGTDLLLVPGDVVTGDLAIGRLADGATARTAALVAPLGTATGVPVRVTRGGIRAAASAYHRISHQSHVARGVLRVGIDDAPSLRRAARELAELLEPAPPQAWSEELARKREQHDPGAPSGAHDGATPDPEALETDVVALLLVALVRAGVTVRAEQLPAGLPWVRVGTPDEVVAAATAVREVDEERIRLDAAVKEQDGFFTTFFVSPYSRYWARWSARHGVTPNQVTVASMAVGVVAATAFATGSLPGLLTGAVLLQLSFTLDCVDGQLARYTRRFSDFGAWLDSIFDRGKEYLVFAGLAAGGVRAGDDTTIWLLAGGALALQTFRHLLDLGYTAQQDRDLDRLAPQPLAAVDEAGAGHWEPVPATPRADEPGPPVTGHGLRVAARRTIAAARRAEGIAPLKWGKRIVVLPIGERFLVISLVTPLVSPRATFLVLLVWGGIAGAYTFGGRLVRSVS